MDRDVIEILLNTHQLPVSTDNIADVQDFNIIAEDSVVETVEGNTNNSSTVNFTPVVSKQGNQLVNWCCTWNNYPLDAPETLSKVMTPLCKKYVFQKEIGKEGTPHLQGTFCLRKKMRWSEFNLPLNIHWEKTINVKASFEYCSKDDTRDGLQIWRHPTNIKTPLQTILVLRPWQQKVVDAIMLPPDDRTVNWVYNPEGNQGKTVFAKYMYAKHDAIIATGGGAKDIACLLALLKKDGRDLNKNTTFIFNLARSTEHISWKAIESVKDGLMTSVKYESSTLVFNCPHVWVLSNELPDVRRLSADRWKIWSIINNDLTPYQE